VVVVADLDIVLAGQLAEQLDGVVGLRGHAMQVPGLGEVEDLARLRLLVGDADHAVVHGRDAELLALLAHDLRLLG
jgi:hypothetical protein